MNSEPRVLIVESNDILRVMLFTILRHQPVSVDTAVSAEDALKKVTSCDYALVIVDADMSDAVDRAFNSAQQGDIVLLAPACASFDMFESFELRGRVFKEEVSSFEFRVPSSAVGNNESNN